MVIDKSLQKCDGPLIILKVKETRDHYGDEETNHLGLSVYDCPDRLQ